MPRNDSREDRIVALSGGEIDRIETDVARILDSVPGHIWNGRDLPVPIDLIATEVYGLRVRRVRHEQLVEAAGIPPESGGTISGLLLTGTGEIWVNDFEAAEWQGRRARFTICHELGHFVMHQTGSPRIFCRSVEDGDGNVSSTASARPVREVEADAFAAALLMPAEILRGRIRDEALDYELLCDEFEASRKAIGHRVRAVRQLT
ncbi:MAG: ImmA/IrrE family metallo-endopeptidase [Actinomycetota bacterium]|nr:ImmA/IrrE family metallo-endopeptidase [Actinomycetota bacterium]